MTYKNIIHLQEWKHHKNKSGLVLILNRSKFQTFISFMMVILVTITAIIVHNHTKKICRFPSQLKLNNIIATRSLEVFSIYYRKRTKRTCPNSNENLYASRRSEYLY